MITQPLTFEQLLERDGHLAFTNKGVSMRPLIREGRDVILITKTKDPATECRKLDAVLFKRPRAAGADAYVLHRILRINPDGTYWIVGDNCISGDTVRKDQILGILTGVIRDGTPLFFQSWRYRLYVNTWCRCCRVRFLLLRLKRSVGRCLRRAGLRK